MFFKQTFSKKHLIIIICLAAVCIYMYAFNESTNSLPQVTTPRNVRSAGAVTGSLFSGDVIRKLPLTTRDISGVQAAEKDNMKDCDNWAVVTTIFHPSDAVIQMSRKPEWCLVIVSDKKTPNEEIYLKGISSERVIYLSIEMQNKLFPTLSINTPLNHFGRKNIGYMYAIQHKAKVIWDFDDDNIGIVKLEEFTTNVKYATACPGFSSAVLNPYPYFAPKDLRVWPRGFPLQAIKNNNTIPEICNMKSQSQIGVLQSLANIQPDVDAIYRLTHDMPFNFTSKTSHPPLVLPKNVYSPFNAQATLWMSPRTFAYLALPISVNGRVSDIWRSYIAQYFMHKDGSQLAFSAPYVYQKRNDHKDIKDFNAEIDLYEKSEQLVEFLSTEKSGNLKSLIEMYQELYKRGYLEIEDVDFIEVWTKTLKSIQEKS